MEVVDGLVDMFVLLIGVLLIVLFEIEFKLLRFV